MRSYRSVFALAAALAAGALAGCDGGVSGDRAGNQPPETALSVRDADLTDNIPNEEDYLTSSVAVSWSGTDVDGFVVRFELRYYAEGEAAPDAWASTTRNDSLILLPIPVGQRVGNVVFEVRAVDNEGAVDPTPARTVFPLRNSAPTLRITRTTAPADTTWPVFSFALAAEDPDGAANLDGLDVSLNGGDWVRLPAETDFLTFVAEDPRAATSAAAVYVGRAFFPAGAGVPGLVLDGDNSLRFRAVDQSGAVSDTLAFPFDDELGNPGTFYVRRVTSDVLLVNDYRSTLDRNVMPFHREALARYGTGFDEWDLSDVSGVVSAALPAEADPTLRHTLALWDRIYWVSNAATDRIPGYNLPAAAGVLGTFFDGGGRAFFHLPITIPTNPEDNVDNPAVNTLPLADLVTSPDTDALNLRLNAGRPVTPIQPVPGVGAPLPAMVADAFITGTTPYVPGPGNVVLWEADYYRASPSNDWTGPETVATISEDRRVALVALPLVRDSNGAVNFVGADGDADAVYEAVQLILASLTFPR